MLARRSARRYDEQSLGLAAKLVELHPEVGWRLSCSRSNEASCSGMLKDLTSAADALSLVLQVYTVWNYRREALQPVGAGAPRACGGGC